MTDEEALRAAVLAHPDDDTPRLVYADWCDDAGHADRAAFIRAQIEAARAEPWSPVQRELGTRAERLKPQQLAAWFETVGPEPCRAEFVRGFVEGVELSPTEVVYRLDELFAVAPIRCVRLQRTLYRDLADEFRAVGDVLGTAALERVTALDLSESDFYAPDDFEFVTDSGPLAGLTDLRLAALPVPPEWLGRFLTGEMLSALSCLDLSNIPNLGPALARGLQAAAHRRVTRLNVSGVRFLSDELKRALATRALAEVEELRLGWPFPGPGPLTMLQLGWVMPWARLRLLDLAGQQLGPDGVKEITRERDAAGLRWLGLARNHLGTAGAEWLLESPHLNLYHLDVSGNGLPPQLLAALRARFPDALVVG